MTAAERPAQGGLSIGVVLERLRREFPDVTISKIRFLESEGLLRPARSAAGYRQFTGADVERLRFVLTAQRDHYLPLKVIKQQLDAADSQGYEARGDTDSPPALVPVAAGATRGDPSDPAVSSSPVSRQHLLRAAGIGDAALDELERSGLVCRDRDGYYAGNALDVARTVRAMGEFGIEPRHLRVFRASVDRELALLEQALAPLYRGRGNDSRVRLDKTVRELASLSSDLHALLLTAGLGSR